MFADWEAHQLIPSPTRRQRSGKLSRAEMLFIMVLFHLSPYKNFKTFSLYGIGCQHCACFRDLPHYDRFVSLMPRRFVPLMVLRHSLSGEESGVYFADSSKLTVCHNCRIGRHRVFDGLPARGKTSTGWFFGLKLHFVINHKGQIMALKITPGNTVLDEISQHLRGKLYADKGYISREVFTKLWQRGLHLITGIRRNMRNHLMVLGDKIMLRKRFVIEIWPSWCVSRLTKELRDNRAMPKPAQAAKFGLINMDQPQAVAQHRDVASSNDTALDQV